MQTPKIENLAKLLQSMLLFFHFLRVRPRRLPPPHKGCCLSHIIKYFPFTYFDSLLSPGFKRNNRSGFIKLEDAHKNNHMFKTRIEFEDKPFSPSFETQVLSSKGRYLIPNLPLKVDFHCEEKTLCRFLVQNLTDASFCLWSGRKTEEPCRLLRKQLSSRGPM